MRFFYSLFISSLFDGGFYKMENSTISFLSFSKFKYRFENIPSIKSIIFTIVLVLVLVVLGVLRLSRWRADKLVKTKGQLEKLQKISANQEIINMSQKSLIDRLNTEGQSKSISKSRWVVFLEEYNKINPDFNKHLLSYGLTKGDMRLAILLASQLNFHEIATLLAVNVETVYVQRQRLRKKLNLENSKELNKFLVELVN